MKPTEHGELNLTRNELRSATGLTLLLVVILLCYKSDSVPLKTWDESLYAYKALDIATQGEIDPVWENFRGKGEKFYETKPRIVFYLQAFFMKLFGFESLLAIRFHSLIAAFLTSMFVLFWIRKNIHSSLLGIFTVLVLFTLPGYTLHHVARTGEYDALLVLFSTTSVLFLYVFFTQKETKFLYFFFLCLTGAVVVKSIAGLLFLPGIFVYALYKKELGNLLYSRHLYIGSIVFLVIVSIYYWLHEIQTPGYLHKVWTIDIIGRYSTVVHTKDKPFEYYIQYLLTHPNNSPWIIFVPLGLIIAFFTKDEKIKNLFTYLIIIITVFVLILSFADSKVEWYLAPIYPFLALFVGYAFYKLYEYLIKGLEVHKDQPKKYIVIASFLIIFLIPAIDIMQQIQSHKKPVRLGLIGEDKYLTFFKKIQEKFPTTKNLAIYRNEEHWSSHLLYYQKLFNQLHDYEIMIVHNPEEIKDYKYVVTYNWELDSLNEKLDVSILFSDKALSFIEVINDKLN